MTGTYNGYLSKGEQFFAALESAMNAEVTNAVENINIIMAKHRISEAEIENRVITESGTYEDLELLLEASSEDAATKSKSFLGKIVEAIRNFFKTIAQKISSVFRSEQMNKLDEAAKQAKGNIELDKDPNKVASIFNNAVTWIKSKMTTLKTGGKVDPEEIEKYQSTMKKGLAAVGGVAVAATSAIAMGKAMNAKMDDYIKETDVVERQAEALENGDKVNSAKELLTFYSWASKEVGKDIISLVTDIGSKIKSGVTSAVDTAKSKLPGGKKDKDGDSAADDGGDEGGSSDDKEVKESATVMGYDVENEAFLESVSPEDRDDIQKLLDIF